MATVRLHAMLTFLSIGVCISDLDMTTYMEGLTDGYGMEAWDQRLAMI